MVYISDRVPHGHGRDPCPWIILHDFGGAFCIGAISSTIWHSIKGFRNSPYGQRWTGVITSIKLRVPVLGGNFGIWGGLFSTYRCAVTGVRGKEDVWSAIGAGFLTGGSLAMRGGLREAVRGGIECAVLLAAIEGTNITFSKMLAGSTKLDLHLCIDTWYERRAGYSMNGSRLLIPIPLLRILQHCVSTLLTIAASLACIVKMATMWKHKFRGKSLVFAVTAASCQAFLLLGYDQGVMAGIIGADNRFGRDFNEPDADMQGNITSLYNIGCVVGSILSYFVGERLGRRTMLMPGASIMIIGAILLAASYNLAALLAGRIITGIGNGMNSSTAPVYLSECSPASIRGALLTLQGTVTILGVVIAYWTDYGTSFYDSSFQWRFPLAFQAFFAIFIVLQVIGLPETPRWLAARDRHEEAREVISAIMDKPPTDESVTRVLLDIQSGLEEEHKDGPFKFKELLEWGTQQNLRRLLLIISIQMGQQFSGSNMINYYAPVIFQQSMHLSRNLSLILGGCAQITYLVGSAIPVLLMDRFGRRVLLIACSAGLCFCFVMVTILLSLGSTGAAYGATAFIFLFQLFYGVGWLPVPWFYPSELSTTRVRSKMQAIASGWNWMAVFAVVNITPISFENIEWRTFIIFAVLNAFFIPMVYVFYPETKGLELEDIPLLFYRGGVTGGVLLTRGRTVTPGQHALEARVDAKQHNEQIELAET
ncbi:Sugar transporter [Fusarium albosuccineum]|uniref:Sugar transporter n=1 Tax=Fusarium albosuccineum TaxID=1237068 RepID=A0A8H4LC54_9HYPO|nr:Sugar transporter [Fusarium albosuccineum]